MLLAEDGAKHQQGSQNLPGQQSEPSGLADPVLHQGGGQTAGHVCGYALYAVASLQYFPRHLAGGETVTLMNSGRGKIIIRSTHATFATCCSNYRLHDCLKDYCLYLGL